MAASLVPRLLQHLEHIFARVRKAHDKHLWVREFQLALEAEARGATASFVEKEVLRLRSPLEARMMWRDVGGAASRDAWEAAVLQVYRDVYRAVFSAPDAVADHFLPGASMTRHRRADAPTSSLDEVVDRAVRRSLKGLAVVQEGGAAAEEAPSSPLEVVEDEPSSRIAPSPWLARQLARIEARRNKRAGMSRPTATCRT
jgi:hypothetical protein